MPSNRTFHFALLFCAITTLPVLSQTQEPADDPAALNSLFSEAENAFSEKQYSTAVSKIDQLLKSLKPGADAPYELLYFNLGLANLLSGKYPEAEAAFQDSLKRYPKGEYAPRSNLGLGRASMLQESKEKKEQAIVALKAAALDPKLRSEAGMWLGQVYSEIDKKDEALAVYRSLMGANIRTLQQATAALEVLGLLAETGKIEDLSTYLENLSNQVGIRESIAWYANQLVLLGDRLVAKGAYEPALIIYRSVPSRSQILEQQSYPLESMRRELTILDVRVKAEEDKKISERSNASQLHNTLQSTIELAEEATASIEKRSDLDAALLMRRGRSLYYLNRNEEALTCFRTIRKKYSKASDAEAAAYAEIALLHRLARIAEIRQMSELFIRNFPKSEKTEQIATFVGELLINEKKWDEVRNFYQQMESDFPSSKNLDRYVFFQALAYFSEGNFEKSIQYMGAFAKKFPTSSSAESALYYLAMSNFASNKYKETLAACNQYLKSYPDGDFKGDILYRLSFIEFNDKEDDQSAKIIRDLESFLKKRPDDASSGAMYCLLADTHKRIGNEESALFNYTNAVWTSSSDDILQYAIDSATDILQSRKDWAAIAQLHSDFMRRKPDSKLALLSASWVAKMKTREGKGAEATAILTNSLKSRIGDPASEQVEPLIDELVKTLVPRKKISEVDVDALDNQLKAILEKMIVGQESLTSFARVSYARARLAQLLRRNDLADLYLKSIATSNAKDPSGLSPILLSVSGDILLKSSDLDGASAMFTRLTNRYEDSIYSDAGPVGMAYIALARKQPEDALKIFNEVLENNQGTSRFKEATIGKLEALVASGKLDEAVKLALEIVGDKSFRGESVAKAYLNLAQVYRSQSAITSGEEAKELLKKAHGTYQRVYVAYQAFPDLCAEAYMQAYETAKQLGEVSLAQETLKMLKEHPKLQHTAQAKKASTLLVN